MNAGAEVVAAQHRVLGRQFFDPDWAPTAIASAPGRIELIGNHLDYNGGPVLAAAIDKRIWVSSRANSAPMINAVFADFDPDRVFSIVPSELTSWRSPGGAPEPVDCLRGSVAALLGRGLPIHRGLDLVISGNLAHGVGMSSSAALCVALVLSVSGDEIDRPDLVLIAQEAENRTGSPCGRMDQSASIYGNVIRFDGATNNVKTIAANLGEYEFAVASSGVVRSLATSAYPIRVAESGEALAILQQAMPNREIRFLADIPPAQLGNCNAMLKYAKRPELYPRVHHVITESTRVGNAERALAAEHWEFFGNLMIEGGRSSAFAYEISHPQVEQLVELCLGVSGVLGARMMGGGEGGSVLILLHQSSAQNLRDTLQAGYYTPRGMGDVENYVFTCRIDSGADIQAIL